MQTHNAQGIAEATGGGGQRAVHGARCVAVRLGKQQQTRANQDQPLHPPTKRYLKEPFMIF